MKPIIVILLLSVNGPLFADQYVSGYQRSNGTYVQPYLRSSPNSTQLDNFSTIGNINPYTGEYGRKSPLTNRGRFATPKPYSYPVRRYQTASMNDDRLRYRQYAESYAQVSSSLVYTQQSNYTQSGYGGVYTVIYEEPKVDINQYIQSDFSPPCSCCY